MGIFDRENHDRERGRWGGPPEYGGGYRAGRHGGYHLGDEARYDRDFGSRGWSGGRDRGYGYRGAEGAWSTIGEERGYDRGFGRQGRAWGAGYDRDFGPRRGMMGGGSGGSREWERDRDEYRERIETDYGDPFGDRQSRTPFRVMRGGFDTPETDRGRWGMGNRTNRLGPDYGADYRGWNQGVGDEPYYNARDFRGAYDREIRGRERGGRWF